MTVLVLGPSGPGKSAYAEKLVSKLSGGTIYYISTMAPFGGEGLGRVMGHKLARKGRPFVTVEQLYFVSGLVLPKGATVLLEDASSLLANVLFSEKQRGGMISTYRDITDLCGRCKAAVIASVDGLVPGPEFDSKTCGYIEMLNQLNGKLSEFSDAVIQMRNDIPVIIKGDIHALG
ncbi:MAG: bifunctional adenosylcobinamide kinase/adenosylcobinamide-phosphate guanylyltransferase [Clostridiales bacterium]|jgi:adenosylcobinamide kinase/adenosylcobinamide-phosphate guanylyltransferase|nr:bifunctional adenosylcobinamide kinase/adenosylcobinamide-phosphate guanylyltransferase [Clostridiales bacterium]